MKKSEGGDPLARPGAAERASHASTAAATTAATPDELWQGTPAELRTALDRLQRELISQHRLALLGTISAMVAHEFNNLMTPALAYAHEAVRSDDAALKQKALERVLRQTERAVTIARKLLELSHAAAPRVEPCLLAEVVSDAILSASRPFDKDGIELTVEIDDDVQVLAERLLLEQVLLNLLLNARQALRGRPGRISVTGRASGDRVLIEVSDNGEGIPREEIEQRLNPFLASTALAEPADWQRVGLGLNVCRTIVQVQGATIQAVPRDGAGCTFQLFWPRP